MFTEKLKQATLANHQQTEKVLMGLMKNMRSQTDYLNLLRKFYGYFGGLEVLISKRLDDDEIPEAAHRRKTSAMAADIGALGGQIPPLATDAQLPDIGNALKALGALYVIEGSTLGGSIIAGIMRKHFTFDGNTGLSFFTGYGDDTLRMWDSFKQYLNQVSQNTDEEDVIIQSANQTFARFGEWLKG